MTRAPFSAAGHAIADDVALRPLTEAEARDLAHALTAIDPWARYGYDAAELATYFAGTEAGAPRFGIVRNGRLAGVVGLKTGWLHGPYLQCLGVLPAHQGCGVGSLVMRWLVASAQQVAARNVFVCVSEFNVTARRFYERHGFALVGPLPGLIGDGFTELLMRRTLHFP